MAALVTAAHPHHNDANPPTVNGASVATATTRTHADVGVRDPVRCEPGETRGVRMTMRRTRLAAIAGVSCAVLTTGCMTPPGVPGEIPACPARAASNVTRSAPSAAQATRAISTDAGHVLTSKVGSGGLTTFSAWSTADGSDLAGTYVHPEPLDADARYSPLSIAEDGIATLLLVEADFDRALLRWDPSTGTTATPAEPPLPDGAINPTVTYRGAIGDGEQLLWEQNYLLPGGRPAFLARVVITDNRTDDVVRATELSEPTDNPLGGLYAGSADGRFIVQVRSNPIGANFFPPYVTVGTIVDTFTGTSESLDPALAEIPDPVAATDPFGVLPLTISPNGRYVTLVQRRADVWNRGALYLWDRDTSDVTRITGSLALTSADVFTPPPVRPAVVDDGGTVTYIDLDGTPLFPPARFTIREFDAGTGSGRMLRQFQSPAGDPARYTLPWASVGSDGDSIAFTEQGPLPSTEAAVTVLRCS